MHRILLPSLLALSLASLASSDAHAAPDEGPSFGVGYKVGNGVGFTSLDLLVSPIPRLTIELQAAYLPDFDSGYGVLPALVGSLKKTGSTPYVKAGAIYVTATDDQATASGTGVFANIGYEWKLDSGLGIQLGGGINYIGEITAVSGNTVVTLGGEAAPNLELGLRYRF